MAVSLDQKNMHMCVCGKCPSYNDCAKKKHEGLFCATKAGKSHCAFTMNGCICGQCPVHKNYHLKSGYYCIEGSADTVDKKAH